GYTDLMPSDETNDENYAYTCKINTVNNSFGTPTHDKKYKHIFIKTYVGENFKNILYITVYVDNLKKITPYKFEVSVNELGEIEYTQILDDTKESNLELYVAKLDDFKINYDKLSDTTQQTHKIVISSKGKNISLEIETIPKDYFSIINIGYSYKLGKVKESK